MINKGKISRSILPFVLTFGVIYILYYLGGRSPFGNTSLACEDGYYQYMDLFAFYKDLLAGKQSIKYSFSNGLGMPGIAMFSYYLASPWNLLLLFFDKDNLHNFFDLLVALKLSLASMTFYIFVRKRFDGRVNDLPAAALGVSYGLMQYSVAQASNLMWLDGVYMLPLILLGVFRLVKEDKPTLLSVSVMLSIVFNWYSAGINCLFSILWVLMELVINDSEIPAFKDRMIKFVKYCIFMALGVGMSAFIFFPTVHAITKASTSSTNQSIFRNEMFGNVLTFVSEYYLGTVSGRGVLSVFCGSLILVGVLGFFVSAGIRLKEKLAVGVLLGVTLMCCFWQPLFAVFSMFKDSPSYYYRFSYVICFVMIFAAAFIFSKDEHGAKRLMLIKFTCALALYLGLFIFLNYRNETLKDNRNLYLTVVFHVVFTVFFVVAYSIKKGRGLIFVVMLLLTMAEMGTNSFLLMEKYSYLTDAGEFKRYQTEQQALVDAVKQSDDSAYRMTQTTYRNMSINPSANLNEALAFDFYGIESYISAPVASQINLIKKLGYKVYYDVIVEKMMPVISSDSLLGAKYYLSPYEVPGCILRSDLPSGNGKMVYENPYCFPMAFKIGNYSDFMDFSDNTYDFQNELFKFISDKDELLYTKAEFTLDESDGIRTYTVSIPSGNYALYGDIPFWYFAGGNLDLNGRLETRYAGTHSMSSFFVPITEGDSSDYVTLTSGDMGAFGDAFFYLLDLDYLKSVSDMVNANAARDIIMETNGRMSCTVEGRAGEALFTSIPYVKGWSVYRNGEKVTPAKAEDCLMMVPLLDGTNEITMEYHIPYFGIEVLVSVVSVIGLVLGNRLLCGEKKLCNRFFKRA